MDLDAFEAQKKITPREDFLSFPQRSAGRQLRCGTGELWTAERTARLIELAATGQSATQIAAQIGGTRSAILGRANRIGISLNGQRPLIDDVAHARRRELNRAKRENRPLNCEPPRKYVRKLKPALTRAVVARISQRPTIISSNPVSLLKLQPHHCRWILGDPASVQTMYCGAVVAGDKPYCLGHCNVMYRGQWHA